MMNIPNFDTLPKLFTFIGLALMGFGGVNYLKEAKEISFSEHEIKRLEANALIRKEKAIDLSTNLNKIESDNINKANILIENKNSGNISQEQLDRSLKRLETRTDSIIKPIQELSQRKFAEADSLSEYAEYHHMVYDMNSSSKIYQLIISSILVLGGCTLFFLGARGWISKEQAASSYKYWENIEKPRFKYHCQSCGKKFNSMIVPAKDGDKKNYCFCSDCYEDGAFKEPDLTLQEMKDRTKAYLISYKIPEKKINDILNNIEKLERWYVNRY